VQSAAQLGYGSGACEIWQRQQGAHLGVGGPSPQPQAGRADAHGMSSRTGGNASKNARGTEVCCAGLHETGDGSFNGRTARVAAVVASSACSTVDEERRLAWW
jgi:hypothetical protein